MPKTAPKKSKSAKTSRTRAKATTASSHTPGSYHHQREQFFVAHPNAKILLGIFVVSVALYIGAMLWGQLTLYSAEVNNPGSVQATF